MKRTKWFDGEKFMPSHVGVYERDYGHWIGQSYFDGKNFVEFRLKDCGDEVVIQKLVYGKDYEKLFPVRKIQPWRGLKDKP